MINRNKVLIISGVFLTGAAVGYYALPSKIVEKEKIQYVDRIVEKQVLVKDTSIKKNKVYVKTITIKPDGTKTEETKIVDKDQIDTDQNTTTIAKEDKNITDDKEKTTTYAKQDLIISLAAKQQFNTLNGPSCGLIVEKRLVGPVYIGGFGFLDGSFGLSLGLGF